MRILVVGLGLIARRHICNLKTLDPSASIAVWRQRPDPADWRPPEGLPVDRWFRSRADGMEIQEIECWQPDAAIIANPAARHVSDAGWLGHDLGCHVLIEKPLSDSMASLDTLSTAVALRGQGCCYTYDRKPVLMVGYDLRHFEPLLKVAEAIDAGRIGRPLHIRCEVGQYLPDWRPGRDYRTSVSARRDLGGGVLLELSHEIDYARWLMGEVASVSAMVGRLSDLEIDVEDTADILLRFRSGAMGSIHLDMVDRAGVRRCRVVGTEGSIECDLLIGHTVLMRLRRPEDEPPRHTGIVLPDWMPADGLRMEVLHEGLTVIPDPLLEEMRHFLACCRGEATPPVSGEEGARVLQIALAARRSAEEKREVEV